MTKDPAVLFYPSDFLTGTMLMDYDTKGRYITLLALQQQMGPIKEKNFKEICGDKIDDLSEKFQQDSKGNYFNKRMKYEIDRRKKFTESRRANGSRGGRPPKAKGKQGESYEKPLGLSMDNLMGNGNETETVNEKGKKEETLKIDFGSHDMQDVIQDWVAYKNEKNQGYKPTGLKSLLTRIQKQAEQYGEKAVIEVIGDSMASGYQGIVWDRLRKGQISPKRFEPEPITPKKYTPPAQKEKTGMTEEQRKKLKEIF